MSGGPDSLALLLLMQAAAPAPFRVATVDHGLRAQSADEAAFVAQVCAGRAIAHDTLRLALARGSAVQERARAARYAALAQWARGHGLAALVVAHHADDQAETLLMRLNRGAGVRGLAAMRARAPTPGAADLPLLRPLLGWRRAELAAVVAQAGLVALADPSNADPRHERARLRAALAAAPWLDPAALATSAAHLAQADDALAWVAAQSIARLRRDGDRLVWQPDVPRVIALRVLEEVVARLGRSTPRGSALGDWYDRLAAGRTATLAGVRGRPQGEVWSFAAAPPHRPPAAAPAATPAAPAP
ncbi:tRNA lysidine(34) synthetase TilS [Novosphingobium huizhouense]|uniref:tRNA lysidine(34) synthetase TilS n=1 Tax=Novosphingobium huizhouense TaxID=2866625 RepID=UPI001CD8BC4E|nr:tRNA lysidine(34) synthetase TilS [Novosphingobium huizhouense]